MPDGFEDEKQSLVPAKPLSSPSFSLFLRAVGPLPEGDALSVPGIHLGQEEQARNEHQTPTVQATVDHVRSVASFVITPCLGDPSMTAQDRARVVECWIQVAQECEILKNFSSPRTVISALQKTSTSHLKNTRGKFPGGALHGCPPREQPPESAGEAGAAAGE
ncbi:ral guanine nucleotide dissociation stimulator-like [Diceros bicornis minor]|uniref:ral guanine nucleotide dissociation stimulator-like n=1 Tax=Diceros bicornis minor TaxID=77932 RepID=UPI0026F2DD7B|nr:ral guanine nucleotide dissociation stimulator-like [Diceros bicornis minor]